MSFSVEAKCIYVDCCQIIMPLEFCFTAKENELIKAEYFGFLFYPSRQMILWCMNNLVIFWWKNNKFSKALELLENFKSLFQNWHTITIRRSVTLPTIKGIVDEFNQLLQAENIARLFLRKMKKHSKTKAPFHCPF
jgi:hypothetical protein